MDLHWSSLGEVAVVSIGATVGVVIVFSLGVRALATREEDGGPARPHPRPGGGSTAYGARRPGAPAMAVAGVCFLACAVAVLYGLYLIVPQFH
ncbi:hypothetical protein [Streptomyces liangshanensis]|uniref:Uncharacterized protein n=1 Tax=Streptomyces liangshanensis TaxID=2717324 RepID=A0A6G9GS37_9ACTN|nr:hypothetical protein [Streptomyces liangshanensis]QIQ01020.1 hypothetical protein HA039_00765 [Streptomyces liangshanensis]